MLCISSIQNDKCPLPHQGPPKGEDGSVGFLDELAHDGAHPLEGLRALTRPPGWQTEQSDPTRLISRSGRVGADSLPCCEIGHDRQVQYFAARRLGGL